MLEKILKNPLTLKRLQRFKEVRLAYIALWILVILYLLSLCSELLCNNVPIYIRFNGNSFFPVFEFYSEDIFKKNGKQTRPDYKKINNSSVFTDNPDNFMVFPPIPFGPFESIEPGSIEISNNVRLEIAPLPLIGSVNIKKDYSIAGSTSFHPFIGKEKNKVKGLILTDYFDLPAELGRAMIKRFDNIKSARVIFKTDNKSGKKIEISLSNFSPRKKAPKTVRLTFREKEKPGATYRLIFKKNHESAVIKITSLNQVSGIWDEILDKERESLLYFVEKRFSKPVDSYKLIINGKHYVVNFIKNDVRFPFHPVPQHLLGIDGAGRDVLARILYGLRTSLTFGLLLVVCSMALGIFTGAIQGYYGGFVDISCQRLIEIWSALPFLYIMILMGSVYGRSFSLLLFCYGLFNWIGISYYIRAEFLRLRQQPFVEAAKCLGVSSGKIIFKHILPNAMAPVITFFPFSLVGAIGSLAALDYLGFG
ncbi:MAG: ABC transporter permease subunit, partial [Deltaproteobacteria bacterium]|nr:ABC transporter permease subunit [Deltaproteobacteria bacterium]